MKKLISLSEIRQCSSQGDKTLYLDSGTIITPAAKDAAAELGVKLIWGSPPPKVAEVLEPVAAPVQTASSGGLGLGGMDVALITKLVMEVLSGQTQQKDAGVAFTRECDSGGLRLIRGNTVKCEPFDTGNPTAKVGLTDIVNTRESPNMGAGFMTIHNSAFDWELNYEEFDVILEGTLNITINGKTYSGKAGDVFFIPKGSKITWSTPDYARFFYATYPANWAELV